MNLTPFLEFILAKCGLTFENERVETLAKGIRSRMAARGIIDDRNYLSFLTKDPDEFAGLVNLLTVNETYFFREPAHLQILAERLIPELLLAEGKNGGKVRVLSAGCSTGEEAYSIAMTLIEKYGAAACDRFSVMAVDIDSKVIARAKEGIFGKGAFRGFSEERRRRFFDEVAADKFRIRDEVKRLVTFAIVNLRSPLYPEAMQMLDVIFYRNVSIYFPSPVQRDIFTNLAGTLKNNGYLFLSASETIFHNIGLLSLMEIDHNFLYRKGPLLDIVDRRLAPRNEPAPAPAAPARRSTPAAGSGKQNNFSDHRPPSADRTRQSGHSPPATSDSLRILFDGALALARDKEYTAALQAIDRLLGQNPGFVKCYMLKASILINLSRLEEATTVCSAALELDRWCLEGYLLLGIIARIASREEEALLRFKESLYIDSSCWLAHFYLAEIHAIRHERELARREYEIVMNLFGKEDHPDAGLTFFPLAFKPDQIVTLCRHNLAKLGGTDMGVPATSGLATGSAAPARKTIHGI
ncbi:MAG: hypothetical protein JJE30_08790 [Desulfuromonadales bacterium]|nr:hypothetical protein [Desulfuromonadales bacterium]